MKSIYSLLPLIILSTVAFAQTQEDQNQRQVITSFLKYIVHPQYDDGTSTLGATLFKVIKNDSIVSITVIYSSEKEFDISAQDRVIKHIEKRVSTIKDNLRLIVPVYFYFEEMQLPLPLLKLIKRKIKRFKKQGYTILNKPGIVEYFEPIRKS